MSDVTQILGAIDAGDANAAAQLLPLVYDELRRLAAAQLAHEKPGQTLDATALVHEAWLRLAPAKPQAAWGNRRHFFAAAAEAMRRILVENARRKGRVKHGGGRRRVEWTGAIPDPAQAPDDLLAFDDALEKLAAEDAAAAEIVKLHVFAGLTLEETAQALNLSRATVYRHWAYARAWLRCALAEGGD
ncbi:MAG: ECF-type sigma factor [Gemmataceae bacterium]